MKLIRKHVNKYKSASKFRHSVGRTKVLNLRASPQRGGWRL